jgi:SAM-dependent methyltransferase
MHMKLQRSEMESIEEKKKDQTANEIMQRIRARLARDFSFRKLSASTGQTGASPMEQIDFEAINARMETTEKRSLVSNTSPGMKHFPIIVRPFARLVVRVILFFGRVIARPQEAYNVAAIQAMRALRDGMCSLAERQAILLKELAALNQRVTDNIAFSAEQRRDLLKELARVDKLIAENLISSIDDELYVSFENKFRGARQEIKDRARVYLPVVARALSGAGGGTVLDLGCGRGEWLELLREQNVSAYGVDSNRAMVEECRSRSLPVEQADVVQYLKAQKRDAFAAVTGFHLIEHLPLGIWIRLIDQTLRILKPGGVAIFETPNPENILVGSNTFYFDPTHRNPLPSATVQFIASERGFDPVDIVELHPVDPENLLTEATPVASKFNYYFYGPRDYAIMAWKK